MSSLTDCWLVDISVVLSLLLLALYVYFTWHFNYWKDRNVPFAKPVIGFGSLSEIGKGKGHSDIIKDIYKQFEGERYCGFFQFGSPTLMVRDPKLIDQILIKDFSHFQDRPLPINPEKEPLTVNLVNLRGGQWRNLRYKLSPTFTSGKLKGMFKQMCNCCDILLKRIEDYTKTKETVNIKMLMTKFSLATIASCAFGLQIESEGPEGKKFMEMVKKTTGGDSIFSALRLGFMLSFPQLANFIGIRSIPLDAHEYFMSLTKATIDYRVKTNIKRDDFLQMLLTLKDQDEAGKPEGELDPQLIDQEDIQLKYEVKPTLIGDRNLKFTEELIAAQSFVFLAAGSDTVSNSIGTVLHFVAAHSEVQSRLQDELDQVLSNHGSCTYEALKDMTYMDQVIQETQRLFPIAYIHVRSCTTPFTVPDSDLVIEKGMMVVIPAQALHLDPAYYPNPETFDPDRFEGNNFKPSAVFSPFGDGPRICIAMRFAILEMKICLAKILSNYCVISSPKTTTPLRYDPKSFNADVLGGIWLSFTERPR